MAADPVYEAIFEEGGPYLNKESADYVMNKVKHYIDNIENWILQASKVAQYEKTAFNKVWYAEDGKSSDLRAGVNWRDYSPNTGSSLQSQFNANVEHIENSRKSLRDNYSTRGYNYDLSTEMLLKNGYKLLSRLGEALRGDTVDYTILIHDSDGELGINDIIKYNMNLNEFIDKASIVSSDGYSLKVGSKTQLSTNFKPKKLDFSINQINLFINELKGYFLFAGNERIHMLDKYGNDLAKKVTTINLGHVFEAAMNYPEDVFQQLEHSLDWVTITENAEYWSQFDENAVKNIPMIKRIFDTLSRPSPFFQGGEGGPRLANTQVKTNGAGITNLTTLMRQMLRIRMIYRGLRSRVYNKSDQKLKSIPQRDYQERVAAGVVRMFDRRFGDKRYRVNIKF